MGNNVSRGAAVVADGDDRSRSHYALALSLLALITRSILRRGKNSLAKHTATYEPKPRACSAHYLFTHQLCDHFEIASSSSLLGIFFRLKVA